MEISYELKDIENLNKPEIPDDLVIRWQKVPDDYFAIREFWLDKNPDWQSTAEEWEQWMEKKNPVVVFIAPLLGTARLSVSVQLKNTAKINGKPHL